MTRAPLLLLGLALTLAACGRGKEAEEAARQGNARGPGGPTIGITPMTERVAVLGVLNKRNGIVKDVTLKPGQSAKWRNLLVQLKACETTAPWEEEKLTGAFIQVDVQGTDSRWRRVFSGWVYKESPSLNVVENAVYDVWPKSCAMTYPAGPEAPAAPVSSSSRSSAQRSGGESPPAAAAPAPATPSPAPSPSAADNNAT